MIERLAEFILSRFSMEEELVQEVTARPWHGAARKGTRTERSFPAHEDLGAFRAFRDPRGERAS
jgi:hypothetical protein